MGINNKHDSLTKKYFDIMEMVLYACEQRKTTTVLGIFLMLICARVISKVTIWRTFGNPALCESASAVSGVLLQVVYMEMIYECHGKGFSTNKL